MTAAPMIDALTFPVFQNSPADLTAPADGIQLNTDTCTGQNASSLNDAIFDAGIYAKSVAIAAEDMSSPLYSQFFKRDDRSTVGVLANVALRALQGHPSEHVDVYCTDILKLCDPAGHVLGYSYTPSFVGDSFIILCPAAKALGRAPPPCSAPAGSQLSASTSHVMFHLVLTISNVMGQNIGGNHYGVQSCSTIPKSTTMDAKLNADSFAQLAIAQWGYGLGGPPYSGAPCRSYSGLAPTNQKRDTVAGEAKPLELIKGPSQGLSPRQVQRQTPEQTVKLAQQCTGDQLTLVQNAAQNARAMAALARDNTDDDLWKQYVPRQPIS